MNKRLLVRVATGVAVVGLIAGMGFAAFGSSCGKAKVRGKTVCEYADQLDSVETDKRLDALRSIQVFGAKAAPVVTRVGEIFLNEKDDDLRKAAFESLVAIGDSKARNVLFKALASEENGLTEGMKEKVLSAIYATLPTTEVVSVFKKLSADRPEEVVRQYALVSEALGAQSRELTEKKATNEKRTPLFEARIRVALAVIDFQEDPNEIEKSKDLALLQTKTIQELARNYTGVDKDVVEAYEKETGRDDLTKIAPAVREVADRLRPEVVASIGRYLARAEKDDAWFAALSAGLTINPVESLEVATTHLAENRADEAMWLRIWQTIGTTAKFRVSMIRSKYSSKPGSEKELSTDEFASALSILVVEESKQVTTAVQKDQVARAAGLLLSSGMPQLKELREIAIERFKSDEHAAGLESALLEYFSTALASKRIAKVDWVSFVRTGLQKAKDLSVKQQFSQEFERLAQSGDIPAVELKALKLAQYDALSSPYEQRQSIKYFFSLFDQGTEAWAQTFETIKLLLAKTSNDGVRGEIYTEITDRATQKKLKTEELFAAFEYVVLSDPSPERRKSWVLDLKSREDRRRLGQGAAEDQFNREQVASLFGKVATADQAPTVRRAAAEAISSTEEFTLLPAEERLKIATAQFETYDSKSYYDRDKRQQAIGLFNALAATDSPSREATLAYLEKVMREYPDSSVRARARVVLNQKDFKRARVLVTVREVQMQLRAKWTDIDALSEMCQAASKAPTSGAGFIVRASLREAVVKNADQLSGCEVHFLNDEGKLILGAAMPSSNQEKRQEKHFRADRVGYVVVTSANTLAPLALKKNEKFHFDTEEASQWVSAANALES